MSLVKVYEANIAPSEQWTRTANGAKEERLSRQRSIPVTSISARQLA
jgi:hypothetical protein